MSFLKEAGLTCTVVELSLVLPADSFGLCHVLNHSGVFVAERDFFFFFFLFFFLLFFF